MNLSQAGFFRRSATVFRILRESASSDTARASDIPPTSALKIRIALDLAARLSLPGNIPGAVTSEFLAGATGLEPAASWVTGGRSNWLNYASAISTSYRYRVFLRAR
jgi:hypothetical protein